MTWPNQSATSGAIRFSSPPPFINCCWRRTDRVKRTVPGPFTAPAQWAHVGTIICVREFGEGSVATSASVFVYLLLLLDNVTSTSATVPWQPWLHAWLTRDSVITRQTRWRGPANHSKLHKAFLPTPPLLLSSGITPPTPTPTLRDGGLAASE